MNPQNPFNQPAPVGGIRPRIADLRGRMVAFVPTSLALNVPGVKPGELQDRITTDIVVLDGGPLEFGGKPEKFQPHTLIVNVPCEFSNVYVSQVNMVNALRGSVNNGVVLGRVVQGESKNPQHTPPWNLAPIDATDHAYKFAIDYWSARSLGAVPLSEPQPIPGAGAPTLAHTFGITMPHDQQGYPVANPAIVGAQALPPVAQPAYASAQPLPLAPPPGAPAAAYTAYANGPAGVAGPGTAPIILPTAPVNPVALDSQAAFAAWQASQQAPAATTQGPVAPISPVPVGVNMSEVIWGSLTDAQRAQIVQSVHAPANPTANPY